MQVLNILITTIIIWLFIILFYVAFIKIFIKVCYKIQKKRKIFKKTLDKIKKIWYNVITEKKKKLLKTRKVLKL